MKSDGDSGPTSKRPVLIAGGGIGGLTLALALARHGIASRVFEARETPPREGAGIQLGPNATRILAKLGLTGSLAAHAVSPHCIAVHDGQTGEELTRLPLGDRIETRHLAPYWVIHRAALHDVLWHAAKAEPAIAIETGRSVSAVETGENFIAVSLLDGGHVEGCVLVGADGLWSKVRRYIDPQFELHYSGMTAARALVPSDQVAARFSEPVTGVWLAPGAHIVHYPVDSGETVAIVAIGACAEPGEGWNSSVARHIILDRFKAMPLTVRELLGAAGQWRQWPLYRPAGAVSWSSGRCVLIGDAAHPILPYLAQGGALAIEDGYLLASLIATHKDQPQRALTAFSRARRDRVSKVQAASAENGRAYHLDGIGAALRNAALRSLPGSIFMRRYDWIYGWQA